MYKRISINGACSGRCLLTRWLARNLSKTVVGLAALISVSNLLAQETSVATQNCLDKAVTANAMGEWFPFVSILAALFLNWGLTRMQMGTPLLRLLLAVVFGSIVVALLQDWLWRLYMADCSQAPFLFYAGPALIRGMIYTGIASLLAVLASTWQRDRRTI